MFHDRDSKPTERCLHGAIWKNKQTKETSKRHDLILVRTVMLESAFLDECSGTHASTKLNGNIKGNVTMAE